MNTNQFANFTREKLVRNINALSENVQDLLKVTSSLVGDRAAETQAKVEDSLSAVQEAARVRGRKAVDVTDVYVRENAWNAVGIAVGVGVVLGLGLAAATLLRRRDD